MGMIEWKWKNPLEMDNQDLVQQLCVVLFEPWELGGLHHPSFLQVWQILGQLVRYFQSSA
jgi:hypothetical protein